VAGAVAAGGIFSFAVVKAWPEGGIFPHRPAAVVVAAVEPERFYPVPEPAPPSARPSSASDPVTATIQAPAPIIVDQGTPPIKRMHPVARAATNSHHREARAVSYRRNGSYATAPGSWW
jgi:hypothetical protein